MQPLDQGIIRSFKVKYKTYFVKYLIAKIKSHIERDPSLELSEELKTDIQELLNCVNLKDAINWIISSWNDITNSVIENCFKHSGFVTDCEDIASDESLSEMSEVIVELQKNINEDLMTSSEFIEFEDEFETCSNNWKEDLINEARNQLNPAFEDIDEIQLSDIEDNQRSDSCKQSVDQISSLDKAIETIEKLETFVIKNTPQVLVQYNKVRNAFIDLKVKNKNTIQTSIEDFLHNFKIENTFAINLVIDNYLFNRTLNLKIIVFLEKFCNSRHKYLKCKNKCF